MFRFLRIERPTTATLRPVWTATSIACCIRWTFEANEATSTRPWRCGMIWRNASPTSRSEPVNPRRSAFVESHSSRSTPRLPSSASRPTSVRKPSTGVWSSFQSLVCSTRPASVSITTATLSGIECAIRTNSSRNGPICDRLALGIDLAQLGRVQQPVLVELRLDQPERQPRRPDLRHPHLAHEVRERADVVLVRMREDDGADVGLALGEVGEVRQDEVDAEVLVAREREAGVDDEHAVLVLEHGHVLPDLAEPAERDDAQTLCHPQSVSPACRGPTPPRRRRSARPARGSRARAASSSSVAGTSGRR